MTDVDQQRDELVERLFSAGLAMGELMTVYLGDTLGLYRALERSGSLTAAELAKETGTFERYAREWLEQQAAAGILTVDDASADPDERRYVLPPGHIEPLLDLDSPYSIAPFCKSFVALSGAMPELVSAFRSGGLVPWNAYGHDMIEAQGDFNRPWLVASLGTEYLPSIPTFTSAFRTRLAPRSQTSRAVSDGQASPSRRPIPTSPWTGSTSMSLRSRSPRGTGRWRACPIASASRRGTARLPDRWARTTSRSWWRRSTTSRNRWRS
jgi:hypothetical protein